MNRVISTIIEKTGERIRISVYKSLRFVVDARIYPVPGNRIFNNIRGKIYL